jgi:catechol 2,3-dioxygenase-like lactoylglutathione lyase family enzyme
MQFTESAEKVTTRGLSNVAINVTDLDRSVRFYTGFFQLDVLRRGNDRVFLHTPGSLDCLTLLRSVGAVAPSGIAHFGFKVDDVNFDRAREYVRRNSIRVVSSPTRPPGRFLYVLDPDGYVIQISTT